MQIPDSHLVNCRRSGAGSGRHEVLGEAEDDVFFLPSLSEIDRDQPASRETPSSEAAPPPPYRAWRLDPDRNGLPMIIRRPPRREVAEPQPQNLPSRYLVRGPVGLGRRGDEASAVQPAVCTPRGT